MSWRSWFGKPEPPSAMSAALAQENETRHELWLVVNELERVVARLSVLPEVQQARKARRQEKETE